MFTDPIKRSSKMDTFLGNQICSVLHLELMCMHDDLYQLASCTCMCTYEQRRMFTDPINVNMDTFVGSHIQCIYSIVLAN